MKEIMKDASDRTKIANEEASAPSKAVIRSRSIPAAVIAHFVKKIKSLEPHVEEVLQAEAVAKMDRLAEMEMMRAQNIIEHSDEIKSRPQRQWFASEKEKKNTKEAAAEKAKLIAEKAGTGKHRMTRKKRRAREAREMFENMDDGDNDEPAFQPEISMKKAAREHKRDAIEKEKIKNNRSVHDEDVERAAKKRKGKVGTDALGDSALFAEEMVTYAPKKSKTEGEERAKSAFSFRGYNPDLAGKKKPKAKAHHKFKSKTKYRRR